MNDLTMYDPTKPALHREELIAAILATAGLHAQVPPNWAEYKFCDACVGIAVHSYKDTSDEHEPFGVVNVHVVGNNGLELVYFYNNLDQPRPDSEVIVHDLNPDFFAEYPEEKEELLKEYVYAFELEPTDGYPDAGVPLPELELQPLTEEEEEAFEYIKGLRPDDSCHP